MEVVEIQKTVSGALEYLDGVIGALQRFGTVAVATAVDDAVQTTQEHISEIVCGLKK